MAKENEIRHRGVVTDVTEEYTTVEFVTESACSGCHARSVCGAAGAQKGSIQVRNRIGFVCEKGDDVDIVLKSYLGMKAVVLCYVIPLVILLFLLLSLPSVTGSEMFQALACLAAVALYYAGIFLFRDRIEKSYEFVIEPRK